MKLSPPRKPTKLLNRSAVLSQVSHCSVLSGRCFSCYLTDGRQMFREFVEFYVAVKLQMEKTVLLLPTCTALEIIIPIIILVKIIQHSIDWRVHL